MSAKRPPRIPGYTLSEEIGRGASARVYRAHAEGDTLGREFAIKVFSGTMREAYDRELEPLQRIERLRADVRSRELVETLRAGEHEGHAFVVMEYLSGGDLRTRVGKRGPLEADEAVALTLQILDGVCLLHQAGLVHRDVKPSNVLLDAEGQPKLADFGLTRRIGRPLSVAGTPGFCAPELLAGDPVTDGPRLDVYSTAATLHFLLTGRAPLPGRPDVIRLESRNVPRGLQSVLIRALAADPTQRPPTAEVLAALLREPAPPRGTNRGDRWPVLVAGVSVAAVLAGVGLVLLSGVLETGTDPTSAAHSSPSHLPADPPDSASGDGSDAAPSDVRLQDPGARSPAGTSPAASAASSADSALPEPANTEAYRYDGWELLQPGHQGLHWSEGYVRWNTGSVRFAEPVAAARDREGELFAVGGRDGGALAWRRGSLGATVLLRLPPRRSEARPLVVRVAVDRRRLARLLVFETGTDVLELHDFGVEEPAQRISVAPAAALLLLPEGSALVLGGPDGRIRLRLPQDSRTVLALRTHSDRVLALAHGPDDTVLVLGDDEPGKRLVRAYERAALVRGVLAKVWERRLKGG